MIPITKKPNRGFSLIELLVVVSTIAILVALVFPVFKSVKVSAKVNSLGSKQEQIAKGVLLYAADSDDRIAHCLADRLSILMSEGGSLGLPYDHLPAVPPRASVTLFPYLKSRQVFQAPEAGYPSGPSGFQDFQFGFDNVASALGVNLSFRETSTWTVLCDLGSLLEPKNSNGKINCTYLDGHRKVLPRMECLSSFTDPDIVSQ